MSSLPWFRMYAEAVDDEKLRLLAFEDRWHFVALMCCKCQGVFDHDDGDMLRRKLAVKLGVQARELEEIERRLAEVGLIDERMQPKKWDQRQYRSDVSTERVQRHRERVKRSNTVSGTDQSRAEQSRNRTEQRDTPRKRGSRLPEDWRAGEELLDWARQQRPDLDVTVEEEKFRDYWLAKTGQNATKRDWSRTFKNWIRNARAPYRSAGGGTGDENYI